MPPPPERGGRGGGAHDFQGPRVGVAWRPLYICPVYVWARSGPPVVAPAPSSGAAVGGREGRKGRRVCSTGRRARTPNVTPLAMPNGWQGQGDKGNIAPAVPSASARVTASCTARRMARFNHCNGHQAEIALGIHVILKNRCCSRRRQTCGQSRLQTPRTLQPGNLDNSRRSSDNPRGFEPLRLQVSMDTLGIEPRAFRMRSGCDTTTPCARVSPETEGPAGRLL